MSRKRHSLFILKVMLIFEELLESYSQLRKRRYSFTEGLLVEGQRVNSFYNAVLGKRGLGAKDTKSYISALEMKKRELEPMLGKTVELKGLGNKRKSAKAESFIADIELRIAAAQQEPEGEEDTLPQQRSQMVRNIDEESGGATRQLLERQFSRIAESATAYGIRGRNEEEALGAEEEALEATQGLVNALVGEDSRTWQNVGKLIRSMSGDSLEVSRETVEEFAEDLTTLLDVVENHASDKCVTAPKGSKEREVLDRFFTREGGKTIYYGSKDGANPPKMLAGYKHVPSNDDPEGIALSSRDRAYGIRISSGPGREDIFKDLIDEFGDKPICGEEVSEKGNHVPCIKASSSKGCKFATARSDFGELAPQILSLVGHLRKNPNDEVSRRKVLEFLALLADTTGRQFDGFRSLVTHLDNNPGMPIPEGYEYEELAGLLDSLGADMNDPGVSVAVKLLTVMLTDSKTSKSFRTLETLEAQVVQTGKFLNGKDISQLKGHVSPENSPFNTNDHIRFNEDSATLFNSVAAANEFLTLIGSTSPKGGKRRMAADQGHVGTNIKTYAPPTNLRTKDIAMGTQVASNALNSESGDSVMKGHLIALREAGLSEEHIQSISSARAREKEAHGRIVSAFSNLTPPSTSDKTATAQWVKGVPPNLDHVKSEVSAKIKNLASPELERAHRILEDLESFQANPENFDKKKVVDLQAGLMSIETTMGKSDRELRAKMAHDYLISGAQTADCVMSAGVIGEGLHETTQSKLVDDTLIAMLNGDYKIHTSPTGKLSIRDPNTKEWLLKSGLRFKDGFLRYESNCRGGHIIDTAAK
jgi:hypothetical protein